MSQTPNEDSRTTRSTFSTHHPLRVAIIGSGPAAFYTAGSLRRKELSVEVDMYDRLPTPFGLVRGGVAPDHPKIKSVARAYDRTASKPNFRFYGNVEIGSDVTLDDLKQHYHQIVFCTGAQTDKHLNIPGIDLGGSHAATEFVAWYNGHPDYRDLAFDLTQERVAVIGIGNVAMDVARILCRTTEELRQTDIAGHALEALSKSNVKEVYVLGRRGPVQAAFTTPEIREMGNLEDTDVFVLPEEAELDELSQTDLGQSRDRALKKKVEIIQQYAANQPTGKSRKLTFRFLISPVELFGDANGRVNGVRMVKNELYRTDSGTLRPRAAERRPQSPQYEEMPVGLVFRSIGYRGIPLPGVPFNDSWGVIPNRRGRVTALGGDDHVVGLYTAGWIKRGPSGVIGTNKPDAVETVNCMVDDLTNGVTLTPPHPGVDEAEAMVRGKQPRYVTYADWKRLDQMEIERGEAQGRPRLKFTRIEEMLEALGK